MCHEQAKEHSLRINKNVVNQNSKPETTVFRRDIQWWYVAQKAETWKYWIKYWYTISIQGCSSKNENWYLMNSRKWKKKKKLQRKQYLDRTNYVSYGVVENKMFKNEKGHWNAQ